MNLFIDTNIFLDFYHLSGADIEELNKLTALLTSGAIKLFVPSQLCEEFKRNRDGKIKDAMNEFSKARFKISFPAFCKLYPEYQELQRLLNSANEMHSELNKKAMLDVNAASLKADEIIANLFEKAIVVECTGRIFNRALERFRKGNPPGKKKATVGDEMNWEALLQEAPSGEDIHFVSGDSDYSSPIETDKFNSFLATEWADQKKSMVLFYNSLQGFFERNYPDIRLASDVEKKDLIERLAQSGTFATTHTLIGKLDKFDDFSNPQVESLIEIADLNSQVNWIIGDDDVRTFYEKLRRKYGQRIGENALETLNRLLPNQVDDEIPF